MSETTAIRYVGRDSDGVVLDEHNLDYVFLPGESVDVDADLAERCLEQPANWELVDSPHDRPARRVRKDAESPDAPVSSNEDPEATTAPEAPDAPEVKE